MFKLRTSLAIVQPVCHQVDGMLGVLVKYISIVNSPFTIFVKHVVETSNIFLRYVDTCDKSQSSWGSV
jgi:hypothetical protein